MSADLQLQEYRRKKLGHYLYLRDPSPTQCGIDCPLRRSRDFTPDSALPEPPERLQSDREQACDLLYGPVNEWQTRLLLLDPGKLGARLCARLYVVDVIHCSGAVLHEKQRLVQYNALSYTWGVAKFPREIKINDVDFPITENLFAFLQRYRDEIEPIYLWVDAICINQYDVIEKGMQVKHMLAIYERAEQVVVWLGEEALDTKLAVNYLIYKNTRPSNLENDWGSEINHSEECENGIHRTLRGFADMVTRNWVRRIWVKQEVWAANSLVVRCGTSQLEWDQYISSIDYIKRLKGLHPFEIPPEELSCLEKLKTRAHMRHGSDTGEQPAHPMLSLLHDSADCQFTVPHDRIYALLGMSSVSRPDTPVRKLETSAPIPVDYKIPLGVLFSRLAMRIMNDAGPAAILASNGVFRERPGLRKPSWTPDFRSLFRPRNPGSLLQITSFQDADRAQMLLSQFHSLNRDSDPFVVRLRGWRVAMINTTPIFASSSYDIDLCIDLIDFDLAKGEMVSLVTSDAAQWLLRRSLAPDDFSKGLDEVVGYFESNGRLMVWGEAERGDIVVAIPDIGYPIVLRSIRRDCWSFQFVGCATFLRQSRDRDQFSGRDTSVHHAYIWFLMMRERPLDSSMMSWFEEHMEVFALE